RIQLAIALVVWNHLPATGKINLGAIEAAILVLQGLAVATTTRIALDSAHEAIAGRVEPTAHFNVVAAGKIELLVVDPPRHVYVVSADTIFVVGNVIHHLRDESGDVGASGVGEIFADDTTGVGQPLRKFRRLRVEQQARCLASARRQHHYSRVGVMFGAGSRIDVSDAAGEAASVDRYLSRHGVALQRKSPGLQSGRDEDVGRREVGVGAAAAIALATVVTRHPTV